MQLHRTRIMKCLQKARFCLWALMSINLTESLSAAKTEEPSHTELVTDHLPPIDKLLEELDMTHLTEKFFSSGFTETQYVLRMKDMDLRIMVRL